MLPKRLTSASLEPVLHCTEIGSQTSQAGLRFAVVDPELLMLLPLPLKFCDSKEVPPSLVYVMQGDHTEGFMHARQACYEWRHTPALEVRSLRVL